MLNRDSPVVINPLCGPYEHLHIHDKILKFILFRHYNYFPQRDVSVTTMI